VGGGDLQRVPNRLDHSIRPTEHVIIPESDYSVAGPFDALTAHCIPPLPLFTSMCFTIDLDDQARAKAHEIPDVLANGMLAPELEATQLPTAKKPPQSLFGFVRVPSQFPCPLCVDRISSHAADRRPPARP